ncbi:MAG: hypothetical protein AVDCRST_MAG77-1702 [uncultured Chloroflexi bacterium]|uniref:Tryptophan-rich sensory protein n=1 Tax=uncultured Chloroflexota bacterium TaxID=166587 RepID=A0A6J4I9T7_9CHLR|nr:MAG: hypothetical protein AVDCRST_MAG77-1702 [uncultured Chloroflexota bacterium]
MRSTAPRVPVLLVAANLVTLAVTLAVNALANALPLNGRTTGEISDGFPNLFAPAGYVFAIWGPIYLGLTAFAVWQLTHAGRRGHAVVDVGWWFALSNIANALWIVFWHLGRFPATMAAMLVVLVSLCAIAARLGPPRAARSAAERWLVYLPFSVYLGWISVATIANAGVFLLDLGWNGAPLSPAAWTLMLLAVSSALGAWLLLRRGDLAYLAVLVWAFIGIWAKQSGVSGTSAASGTPGVPSVAYGALAAAGVLAALAVWRAVDGRRSGPAGRGARSLAPGT